MSKRFKILLILIILLGASLRVYQLQRENLITEDHVHARGGSIIHNM